MENQCTDGIFIRKLAFLKSHSANSVFIERLTDILWLSVMQAGYMLHVRGCKTIHAATMNTCIAQFSKGILHKSARKVS